MADNIHEENEALKPEEQAAAAVAPETQAASADVAPADAADAAVDPAEAKADAEADAEAAAEVAAQYAGQSINSTVPQVKLEDELKQSFIDYAMSVIVDRALPDVRDGLKPVHRRVLYDMYDLKIWHNVPTKKRRSMTPLCVWPNGSRCVRL